jgi:hypothetical protein
MHEPLTGGDLVEVSDVVDEVQSPFRVGAAGGDGVLEYAPRELFLVELVVGHCIPPGWLRAARRPGDASRVNAYTDGDLSPTVARPITGPVET